MIKKAFTLSQAAHLAELAPPTLDYLCRTKVLTPSIAPKPGRGRRRLYSFGDLVLLRALSRMLLKGLPVARLKKAIDTQRRKFKNLTPETALKTYIVTDGVDVFLDIDKSELVNLSQEGQLAFHFIIDIKSARQEIIERAG